jgi:hypothetical protein
MPSWRRYGVQSACCVHIQYGKLGMDGFVLICWYVQEVSTPQVILQTKQVSLSPLANAHRLNTTSRSRRRRTYVSPMTLNVSSIILVNSDRPLIDGVPVHDAARIVTAFSRAYGISLSHPWCFVPILCWSGPSSSPSSVDTAVLLR